MATLVNIEPGFPRLGLKWFRLQTTSRLPPPGLGFWIWGFVTASCESCLDCSEAFTAVPECVAKGSHLSLEVWRLESCSLSVVLVFATVRSTIAMWSVSLTIGRCSQSDQYEVLEAASRANSVLACFCCVLRHAWRSRWHFAWQAQSFRRVSRRVNNCAPCRVAVYKEIGHRQRRKALMREWMQRMGLAAPGYGISSSCTGPPWARPSDGEEIWPG